jgi:hypothetical protein
MQRAKPRYKLWQIMLAIAAFAGLMAALGAIGAIAILIVISALVLPVVVAKSGHRLRAAAWVSSLYPVLIMASVYATWFTAWAVLGHRPRMSLDDPKFISPIVDVPLTTTYLLMLGLPFAMVICVMLVIAFVAQGVGRDGVRPGKAVTQLLIPVLLWLSAWIMSRSNLFDFNYVAEWFMD